MKKEQLHRMVLSTFFVKNEFNICGFIFRQQWTLFQREGLCVRKLTGEGAVLTRKAWSLHRRSITDAHTRAEMEGKLEGLEACHPP